jgi:hypothetical protein
MAVMGYKPRQRLRTVDRWEESVRCEQAGCRPLRVARTRASHNHLLPAKHSIQTALGTTSKLQHKQGHDRGPAGSTLD